MIVFETVTSLCYGEWQNGTKVNILEMANRRAKVSENWDLRRRCNMHMGYFFGAQGHLGSFGTELHVRLQGATVHVYVGNLVLSKGNQNLDSMILAECICGAFDL